MSHLAELRASLKRQGVDLGRKPYSRTSKPLYVRSKHEGLDVPVAPPKPRRGETRKGGKLRKWSDDTVAEMRVFLELGLSRAEVCERYEIKSSMLTYLLQRPEKARSYPERQP